MADADIHARKHTVRAFDDDLAELTGNIVAMGGLVERQLAAAVDALVKRDSQGAERVIAEDDQVDELEERTDELAIRVLATRQPLAVGLRGGAMALKITNQLERMGGSPPKMAKGHRRSHGDEALKPLTTH